MEESNHHDIFHLLHQKSRAIKKQINTVLKKHHLYSSQWTILFCLHKFGVMTQAEIGAYLNVEAPTITRTVEKMEKSGWVVREFGSDKRERLIEMTEEATTVFNSVKEDIKKTENELLDDFTEKDKIQLFYLLTKIQS